jgi:hypothetical protein
MARFHGFARPLGIIVSWGLLITLACLTLVPSHAQSQQNSPQHNPHGLPGDMTGNSRNDLPEPMSVQQKQSIMRANFEKSKSDAEELAGMAKGLREQLDKPNIHMLYLDVANRADKIEKLAKKIRDETKGF